MPLVETESLVLKSYNLAESDRIVVLLTREHGVVRRRERWNVLNTRRERISRAVQGTLLWLHRSVREPLPASIVRHRCGTCRSGAVLSVPARVSPWPLWDDAPRCARASGGVRTLEGHQDGVKMRYPRFTSARALRCG